MAQTHDFQQRPEPGKVGRDSASRFDLLSPKERQLIAYQEMLYIIASWVPSGGRARAEALFLQYGAACADSVREALR
jgi:hypothetical protein